MASHWDENPEYPVSDWRLEVANDDTRLGYQDWVSHQKEMQEEVKIKIEHDTDCASPREDTCLGIMVCFHRKYDLGDKHDLRMDSFLSWDGVENHLKIEKKATHILPLFLYDHSGITMNTVRFSCPWDSGQVGFIYATAETIAQTGVKPEDVENQLRAEVETYDQYISGDVWGFIILNGEKEIDSCWGFFGRDSAEEAAKQAVGDLNEKDKTIDIDQAIHNMDEVDKTELIYAIWSTLYPNGDMEHEWSPDELDKIAGIFKDAGLVGNE